MSAVWEILVPCQFNDGSPVRARHHREWDKRVMALTGGLTILSPGRGKWVDEETDVDYSERMIPVRIMVTNDSIMSRIADITIEHYQQIAVFYYKVSDDCKVRHATPKQREKFFR